MAATSRPRPAGPSRSPAGVTRDQHHPFRLLIVHDNDIALTSRDVALIGRDKVPGDSISKTFGGFPIDRLHEVSRDASQGKPPPKMIRIAKSQRV